MNEAARVCVQPTMPGQNQPVEDDRAAVKGFAFLIGSVVVTIGVMVASLVIAANHLPR